MTADELPWSVAALAAAVRRGERTAAEIVDTALRRITASEPAHNAYITIDTEGARRQAALLDHRLADGEDVGPLAGVPVAVKDVFDAAGLPTTAGSALFADNTAAGDGPAVAALRRAGAVVVGKTNMDEFAIGPNQTAFGRTNCPADPARYPGGSSAGSAATVAAGGVPAALGSDAGGSVRYPAACCGVVGYKPTFRWCRIQGTLPELHSLDTLGILGVRLDDVVRVAAVFANGPDTVAPPRTPPRFGVPRGWRERCTEEVGDAVEHALKMIRSAGAQVVEVSPVDEAAVFAALLTIVGTEAAASLDGLLPPDRLTDVSPAIQELLRRGRAERATGYVRAQRYRDRLRAEIDTELAHLDALLTPATATVAKRWDADDLADWSIARFLPAFNLTGHPALSLPVPTTGLPVGVQVVGHHGQDHHLLSVAAWLEQRL